MNVSPVAFTVLCAIACIADAQFRDFSTGSGANGFPRSMPHFPSLSTDSTFRRPHDMNSFRREPQVSINFKGSQDRRSGTDRNPTLGLNYNQRLIDNGRTTLDAYGGGRLHQNHFYPHAGLNYEHRFKNDMFIRGQGEVQPGPHGGLSPSVDAGFGWRFRREALPYEEKEEEIVEGVY